MEILLLLFGGLWLAPSLVAGAIAESRGLSFFQYFLITFFLTPFVGIPMALLVKPDPKVTALNRLRSREGKQCPHCAEIIKWEANVCRFCGRSVNGESGRATGVRSTPPPLPEKKPGTVYLFHDGSQQGPFTAEEILALRARDAIPHDVPCWREGFQDWTPLSEVPEGVLSAA